MNKQIMNIKSTVALAVLALTLLMATLQLAYAVAPIPGYGTAVVDGSYAEWNFTTDFFSPMYRAWNNGGSKPITANAYLRYDTSTHTMYVLVLAVPSAVCETTPAGEASVKIDGNIVVSDASPNFAWVGLGVDGNPAHATGYEASFSIDPGTYTIRIHVNMLEGGESGQTSGTPGKDILLIIGTHNVVPEPSIALSLVAMVAAAGGFMVYRRKSQKAL